MHPAENWAMDELTGPWEKQLQFVVLESNLVTYNLRITREITPIKMSDDSKEHLFDEKIHVSWKYTHDIHYDQRKSNYI